VSLSSTLANALSGLGAASRGAEVVSANVANARTPGYGRRELGLSALSIGGQGAGVRIDGITRSVNRAILGDRRLADAAAANADARTAFLSAAEGAFGTPGSPGALGDKIATLSTALLQAASRPDSEPRLQGVLTAATDIASKLKDITTTVQQARMDADAQAGTLVKELNTTLGQVDKLNADILTERASGRDAAALMDQRQRLVDRISQIVPVREMSRDHDQIALFTTGGAILLEGNPAQIGFSPVGVITPDMTLASGALSGLTINGQPVQPNDSSVLGGGLLGAALAVRDELAPAVQAQADALARNLVERFQSPTIDPTLATGAAGLLTDGGNTFLPTQPLDEVGLAGRLTVNAAADPGQGGALWRIRDGLGAVTPGDSGQAAQILRLQDALDASRVPASGPFIGAARSTAGLVSDVLSQIASDRLAADARQAFTAARQTSLSDLEKQDGVDTDAELQSLISIEHAYSANARVLKTVDDLMQQLLGI
jgi:flagellar hook-associated protein 1 FlgK